MRILFVYPNVTRQRSPQLGICMIAAVAHGLGHECDLYDLTTIPEGDEVRAFRSKLAGFDPDLLAVSCRSNEWSFVSQLFQSVDVDDILKVFGGPHATVAPEDVINIADIVVRGEGEDTFSELLKGIANGEDITHIAGSWVKQDTTVIKNQVRNLIQDVDGLPFPDWRIFDDVHYYGSYVKQHFKGAKVVGTFEVSRGCPYACTYCTNDYVRTLYKGKGKWRREKSPERIVEEVSLFRDEYGLDCVYWVDEVVLTTIDRLEAFRELYSSEIGAPFYFMERPENVTDKKTQIIREAGAEMIAIGIESGDDDTRRNTLNRRHSRQAVISAFRTAKKHGLTTHAFTMIGLPGEDRNSLRKTFSVLRDAQPDTVQTTIFYPLRGTKLYEEVVDEGLFDPTTPMPDNYYTRSYLSIPESKNKELLRWQYILTNYDSRAMRLFVLAVPSESVFGFFVLLRKVYITLTTEGLLSTSKKIVRKIRHWQRALPHHRG